MRTEGIARHEDNRQVKPIAQVTRERPHEVVPIVWRRIRTIIRNGLAPAYLFIDRELRVYVLNDCQFATRAWLVERWPDYVGCYSTRSTPGRPTLAPTMDGLAEDIAEHVAQLTAAPFPA
jgi:hypothetical protein